MWPLFNPIPSSDRNFVVKYFFDIPYRSKPFGAEGPGREKAAEQEPRGRQWQLREGSYAHQPAFGNRVFPVVAHDVLSGNNLFPLLQFGIEQMGPAMGTAMTG